MRRDIGPCLSVVIGLISLLTFGCGQRAVQQPTASAPAQETVVPLPEWAPKNPSPEFLRAARVLKPVPEEMLQQLGGTSAEGKALFARYRGTMPASYEFFGSLDDRQIERFRTTKEIRIPAKSLTPKQRAALGRWFENWRTVMKGMGPQFEDYLLMVYKMGGKEDLSNVDVGFSAKQGGGHAVHIYFWVKRPDGSVDDLCTMFAQI